MAPATPLGFDLDDTFKLSLADTHLYKQFGNSVSVPVIRAIAEKIKLVIDNVLGVPPPMYRVVYCVLSIVCCVRVFRLSSHSHNNASTYSDCLVKCVVEKKSQYLQRDLQKGM